MLDDAARDVAVRVTSGAHLFVFGNGGSSTDAAGLATLFADPPLGRPVAAHCLAEDPAVVTALANDVGYELVFTRQLIAHARPGDVAIGLSTSGSSRNVMLAFAHARAHELLTIGIAGYEGGEMASSDDVARCIVVRSDSVHRIQETQAAIGCALWSRVQEQLSELAARGASE
jgi:D-sedoheptulose 7-phosphate isomerase